ncbi:MAG: FAD-dependent oxidoreductase [Dehalococcoidia bacterium]|nr:FAD-dependent oxidoreductase [Dehalococcoidia bacterium]
MSAHSADAVIIGAGHAGLSTSYYLTQMGLQHVVLEQGRTAESWRTRRWDSFTLITPNRWCRLPGFPYAGDNPDGFMKRHEIVSYLDTYASSFGAPVENGIQVTSVHQDARGTGYRVETSKGVYQAPVVVVATGFSELPKIPGWSTQLPSDVAQVHSSNYRNPQTLPPGAVLVVGSAQSGCQIAEELHESGRRVYLCVGSAGRAVMRYRGQTGWQVPMERLERTVDQLPSPRAKFAGNPHGSGTLGGHTINLHQFARDGITLLGRFQEAQGDRLSFAPDLKENLAHADKVAADFKRDVDAYIERAGLDTPPPDANNTDDYEGDDGYRQPEVLELDLRSAGIQTVVWAMGFARDYRWIHLPITDDDGYPLQQRGVTAYPGLYFMGLRYQYKAKSDLFYGVGEDAAFVAGEIAKLVSGERQV